VGAVELGRLAGEGGPTRRLEAAAGEALPGGHTQQGAQVGDVPADSCPGGRQADRRGRCAQSDRWADRRTDRQADRG